MQSPKLHSAKYGWISCQTAALVDFTFSNQSIVREWVDGNEQGVQTSKYAVQRWRLLMVNKKWVVVNEKAWWQHIKGNRTFVPQPVHLHHTKAFTVLWPLLRSTKTGWHATRTDKLHVYLSLICLRYVDKVHRSRSHHLFDVINEERYDRRHRRTNVNNRKSLLSE